MAFPSLAPSSAATDPAASAASTALPWVDGTGGFAVMGGVLTPEFPAAEGADADDGTPFPSAALSTPGVSSVGTGRWGAASVGAAPESLGIPLVGGSTGPGSRLTVRCSLTASCTRCWDCRYLYTGPKMVRVTCKERGENKQIEKGVGRGARRPDRSGVLVRERRTHRGRNLSA